MLFAARYSRSRRKDFLYVPNVSSRVVGGNRRDNEPARKNAARENNLGEDSGDAKKLETLGRACNVDKSIVSRHLKKFVADVRKYLE